jgi:hypothetical protein
MKKQYKNEHGEWTEENFWVGHTYGDGAVVVVERGKRQANGDTSLVFECTKTGKTEKASTGHMTVWWEQSNNRYESMHLSLIDAVVYSNNPKKVKA